MTQIDNIDNISPVSILAMDDKELCRILGTPSFKGINKLGDTVLLFDNTGISVTIEETETKNKVKSVRIMAPFSKEVTRNLYIGDSKEKVLKSIGKPLREKIKISEGFIIWYYWEMFISFEIENPDYIFGITLYNS